MPGRPAPSARRRRVWWSGCGPPVGSRGYLCFWSFLPVLPLQFAEMVVQTIEAQLPELAVAPHPVGGLLEALCLQSARSPLRVAAAGDEAGALENLQVFRDRGKRHIERLRQLRDRRVALGEAGEDRTPSRIRESTKGHAQVVSGHLSLTTPLLNYMV